MVLFANIQNQFTQNSRLIEFSIKEDGHLEYDVKIRLQDAPAYRSRLLIELHMLELSPSPISDMRLYFCFMAR